MAFDSTASRLSIGTELDPLLASGSSDARSRATRAELIIESEAFLEKHPVVLSINPWRPRAEHVRLFAHMRHLKDAGGIPQIAIRRHMVGTDASYLDTVEETLAATEALLRLFGLSGKVRIMNWDARIQEILLRRDFQTFLSRLDPRAVALRVRNPLKAPGLAEYWTTAADCFLAADDRSPYILSDAERASFREHCFSILEGVGFSPTPPVLKLSLLPPLVSPLLDGDTDPDLWRAQVQALSTANLWRVYVGVVRPIDSALPNGLDAAAPLRNTQRQAERSVLRHCLLAAADEILVRYRRSAGAIPRRTALPFVVSGREPVDGALDLLGSRQTRSVLREVLKHANGITAPDLLAVVSAGSPAVRRAKAFEALRDLTRAGLIRKTETRPARYAAVGKPLQIEVRHDR